MAVGPPDLALIDDINVSWFILWHVETMSGELELALVIVTDFGCQSVMRYRCVFVMCVSA